MNKKKIYFGVAVAFAVLVACAIVCNVLYSASNKWNLPVSRFQHELFDQEQLADSALAQLERDVLAGRTPQALHTDEGIAYYVYKDDKLVYWTDNEIDCGNLTTADLTYKSEHFCRANNAYGVVKSHCVESYSFVAFIVIKYQYNINEQTLQNGSFASDFHIDNRTQLLQGTATDQYAIYSESGTYLFSLAKVDDNMRVEGLKWAALTCYVLAFVLFLFLFMQLHWWLGKRVWSLQNFFGAVSLFSLLVLFMAHFNVPPLVFETDLFSPLYYASSLMHSLGHLLIFCALACAVVVTFYARVQLPLYRHATKLTHLWFALLQLGTMALAASVDYLLHDVIGNSSLNLVFVNTEQISAFSLLASLLIFVLLFCFVLLRDKLVLMFKYALSLAEVLITDCLCCALIIALLALTGVDSFHWESLGYLAIVLLVDVLRYHVKRGYNFAQVQCFTLIGCLFVLGDVYLHTQQLKREKYAFLAENVASGAQSAYDIYTQTLLSDVDVAMQGDATLQNLMSRQPEAASQLFDYLDQTYFRNYWNDGVNYTMDAFTTDINLPAAHRYDKSIDDCTLQPYTEHFYINRLKSDSYQFIGIFDFTLESGQTQRLFIVLYHLNDLSNYDVLFRPHDNQINMLLSTAMYVHGEKVYNSGVYVYPNHLSDMQIDDHNMVYKKHFAHYIFAFDDDTYVLVSERHPSLGMAFLIYWTYLFFLYFLLVSIAYWLSAIIRRRYAFGRTLAVRIQRSFILLSVVVMSLAFVVSLVFIYNSYKNGQIKQLSNKLTYIQPQLQSYFQQTDFDQKRRTELIAYVQDLSNVYHTDIHVYNAQGELIATSRPYVFTSGLCGRRINPQVYFTPDNKDVVMEENISQLHYLSAYTTTCNNDGAVTAYICTPMFFSSYNLWRELFFYVALLINLYLIALLITAIIGYSMGHRITKPLVLLGEKMRQLKLGNTNEKIVYNGSNYEEIALLVTEYNLMVDKLLDSARQLATSERESAWRDMARQIAHEIKNPLTPMKLTIQQLQRAKEVGGERFDEYFKKTSHTLIEQIDSLSFIASEFSNFARMPIANLSKVELHEKLRSEVDLFRNNHENVLVSYSSTVDNAYVMADSEQLTQLFNNLIKNAIQAIPSTRQGRVDVVLAEENGQAVVSVSDNGCGISDEVAERLFVPNFTTKSSGMGLGLCIVKNIVAMSKGEITFTSKVDEGTTFVVRFPLYKK